MGSCVLKLRGYGASFPGAPATARKTTLQLSVMAAQQGGHVHEGASKVRDVHDVIVLVVVGIAVGIVDDTDNMEATRWCGKRSA